MGFGKLAINDYRVKDFRFHRVPRKSRAQALLQKSPSTRRPGRTNTAMRISKAHSVLGTPQNQDSRNNTIDNISRPTGNLSPRPS